MEDFYMGTSNNETYHQQNIQQNTQKLRNLLREMPGFCKDYFRGIEPSTSARTRIGYAYDKRTIIELSNDVVKELTKKYKNVQKGIGDIMGGALIETEARVIV